MPRHDATKLEREHLRHSLIVSCQPVPDGPTDTAEFVVGFARAAVAAGAGAVRIESVKYVAAVREAVDVPIVGIVKRDLVDSPVRITPFLSDVDALAEAGADIVAFDATDRARPETVDALVAAVRQHGRLAMADCSCLEDAERALALGVDFVGTTLSGYVGGPVPERPDIDLIAAVRRLTPYVIAEGRLKVPDDAAAAAKAGAFAVVVGSAITRTEHATGWFLDAIRQAYRTRAAAAAPVLALDLGGTKTMAASVCGSTIVHSAIVPTLREASPEAWLQTARNEVDGWELGEGPIGLAVTGLVRSGRWSALNERTLAIPHDYPLAETASRLFDGRPVVTVNDAQAAAWGEYRHGAGRGCQDLVFLTVSTGLGGGIVLGGRLLQGVAGHFGQIGCSDEGQRLEDRLSGRWMAEQASQLGFKVDAKGVFGAAAAGNEWASNIVRDCARRVAGLCSDIKAMLDIDRIVIGGGVGLAEGFVEAVRDFAGGAPSHLRPDVVPAALGSHAGVIGVADLAVREACRVEN